MVCTFSLSSRTLTLAAIRRSSFMKRSDAYSRRWVQKWSGVADRFGTDTHGQIFIDETLLQVQGHYYLLWIAHEPVFNVCLKMRLSREERFSYAATSSNDEVIDILERPILTDGVQRVVKLVDK
jgi:transposase-like protein